MKNNIFNKAGLGLVLAVMAMILIMPVANAKSDKKHQNTSVSVDVTNVTGRIDKIKYKKQYGNRYAVVSGMASDPNDKNSVAIEFYFRSETDPEFSSGYITEAVTDSKGKYWMMFKPVTKGWVVVYAKDNQTGEYVFLGEKYISKVK